MDDWPHVSPFTYRLRGFSNYTTTHYFRHYQLRLWEKVSTKYRTKNAERDDFCIGGLKRHKVALDLLYNFKKHYEQKSVRNIAIMHYVENSHDHSDRFNWIDEDLYAFLHNGFKNKQNNGNDKNLFNNTAIFLYSDHGSRFTDKLNMQRYLEERLPFFSIYLPQWFKEKYKKEYEHLLKNKKKLVSPFDIYATVRHITCLDNEDQLREENNEDKKKSRSISLLREIDDKRSCEHIGISEHYCTCNKPWSKLTLDSKLVIDAVEFSIESMNKLTEVVRQKCHLLELKSIMSAEILRKNKHSASLKIEFVTKPNRGVYETLIHLDPNLSDKQKSSNSYEFSSDLNGFYIRSRNDISRIDAYGEQPACVANFSPNAETVLDLRKYCYCKRFRPRRV
jgi:hypothetical protein